MRKYGTRPDVERYAVLYSATSQTTTCILLRCIHAEGLHFSAFHYYIYNTRKYTYIIIPKSRKGVIIRIV